MAATNEQEPALVPERDKQAGEARPTEWTWVERSVWTERMLEADHQPWPSSYFRDLGLFCLEDAHGALLQSASG